MMLRGLGLGHHYRVGPVLLERIFYGRGVFLVILLKQRGPGGQGTSRWHFFEDGSSNDGFVSDLVASSKKVEDLIGVRRVVRRSSEHSKIRIEEGSIFEQL
jgi:hypothetical protein